MKSKDATVKIDSELMEKIENLISRKENKFIYVNKKQFIDLAVLEKLQKEENGNAKK